MSDPGLGSGPRRSDDGKFWWDGDRWQPVPQGAADARPSGLIAAGWILTFVFPIAGLVISSMLNKPGTKGASNYMGMVSTLVLGLWVIVILFAVSA